MSLAKDTIHWVEQKLIRGKKVIILKSTLEVIKVASSEKDCEELLDYLEQRGIQIEEDGNV